jgi:histidinol-phosphate aminotransferase
VYLGPGRAAVVADPSFSMFRVVTEAVGGSLVRVGVDDSWDLPRDALLRAVGDEHVSVVWLCSPNNPTGRLVSRELALEVIDAAPDALVVVDEAYYEISGQTLFEAIADKPNALLVRTFSKGYGLAGARVGYLVANREVAQTIESVRLPQNMTAFSIAAACRAFADQQGLRERVAAIVAERERLVAGLQARGWEVVPSHGNFVLARPPRNALEVAAWLQGGGLVVRSYPGHGRLHAWLRMTVRAPAEDDRLLARLDQF